jgi:DNA-binding transcriptional LysR family regulator
MDITTHLKTFVVVANCKGFSEAARQLEVVPSVVAKRIAQLEEHVGARLFERTTRTISLTEAGEKLQAGAAVVVSSFDSLIESVGRDESKLEGHIRVMAPTTLTMMYLSDVFNAFLQQHDRITMEIALVDHSANPAEQGFDLAISGRSSSYDGVVDIPLCPVHLIVCASPVYLQNHGTPVHPRDLTEHACLVFKPSGSNWQFQSARGVINVDVRPRLIADDNRTLLGAAVDGLGIASLPAYVARQPLADGALQALLEKFPPQETWFKAYVPKRRQRVARIAALISWLSAHLASPTWVDLQTRAPRYQMK